MQSKQKTLVVALASLLLSTTTQSANLDDAGRRFAKALDLAETKDLLESYTRKSNPFGHLSPELAELAEMAQVGKSLDLEDVNEKGMNLGLAMSGRDVAVRIWPSSPDMNRVIGNVERLGGRVEEQEGGALYAKVPVSALADLNDLDALEFAEPQYVYQTNYARTGQVGEGIRSAAVERAHGAGITGKGVKVGILDFGFTGYDQLLARGEVPRPVATRAFNSGGDLAGGGVVHGTACAEIIYDMAPDAQLYLATAGSGGSASDGDVIQAARWLAEQGVDVINFSGGGHSGPMNGMSPLDQVVEDITSKGILWTIAAGNEGGKHWLGATQDRNGDGLVDVPGNRNGDFLIMEHGGGPLMIMVGWDDWGSPGGPPASSLDIDAYLLQVGPNGQTAVVGQSTQPQNGRGRPIEVIAGRANPGVYALVLKSSSLSATRPVHVIINGVREFLPKDPTGSLGSPGTARSALTVGAVHAVHYKLESYSSQGPTDDGRMKPDIVAPANNSSLSYAAQGGKFPGTSAAAPHAAGFAALIKQTTPGLSPSEIKDTVIRLTREMERPAPNNRVGHGHIDGGGLRAADNAERPRPPQSQPPSSDASLEERLRPIAPLFDLLK